jgi:multidrug efflux pump subunit AcrA (membrane-fusion protein)
MRLVPVYKAEPRMSASSPSSSVAQADNEEESHAGHDMSQMPPAAEEPPKTPAGHSVQISPERQQLIGVRTLVLESRRATRSIQATGRVAFDPELAVAIREYLSVAGSSELRRAAGARLRLLGMGDEEIRRLPANRKSYESLYLPAPGGVTWIYATLYDDETAGVRPGTRVRIELPYGGAPIPMGTVRSLSPVVDPLTRSVTARIELRGAPADLRPDTFVNVEIQVDLGEQLLLPKSGLIDTGLRRVAFVVDDEHRFTEREVAIGPEAGDSVVIRSGLEAGERVVVSAAFLVDAEANLKAAFGGGHSH